MAKTPIALEREASYRRGVKSCFAFIVLHLSEIAKCFRFVIEIFGKKKRVRSFSRNFEQNLRIRGIGQEPNYRISEQLRRDGFVDES